MILTFVDIPGKCDRTFFHARNRPRGTLLSNRDESVGLLLARYELESLVHSALKGFEGFGFEGFGFSFFLGVLHF